MKPADPGSPEGATPQLIEHPTTIADMLRNGLTVGVLRHEDHEGLEKMYRDRDEAHKRGDWELLRQTIDFPITIASDSADEEALTYECSEENFLERVNNAMRLVPKGAVDHNRRFIFLSDHLAINLEENSVKVGEEMLRFKAAHVVMKKDGRWKVKMVVEGGWGKAYRLTNDFKVKPTTR